MAGFLKNIAGGLISGIGSIANSLIQRKTDMNNQQRQNIANMELSKYQYGQQMDMYNKANEYNTPASQMQRFKEAGLNPNLIYGQGNSGNSPNVLPQYRAPELSYSRRSPVNPVEAIQNFLNTKIQLAQLDNLKADRRIKEANATNLEAGKPYYGELWENRSANLYNSVPISRLKAFLSDAELNSLATKTGQTGNVQTWTMKNDVTPMWSNFLYGKYMKPQAQLSQYNSSIALMNARKDMQDLEISNYLSPFKRAMIQGGFGLINTGLGFLKGSPSKLIESTTNYGKGYRSTQNTWSK